MKSTAQNVNQIWYDVVQHSYFSAFTEKPAWLITGFFCERYNLSAISFG